MGRNEAQKEEQRITKAAGTFFLAALEVAEMDEDDRKPKLGEDALKKKAKYYFESARLVAGMSENDKDAAMPPPPSPFFHNCCTSHASASAPPYADARDCIAV